MLMVRMIPYLLASIVLAFGVVASDQRGSVRLGQLRSTGDEVSSERDFDGPAPWLLPAVMGVVGCLIGSPLLVFVGPPAFVWVRHLVRARTARGVCAADEIELLAVVDALGHELRSGGSLARAFSDCCPPTIEDPRRMGESQRSLAIAAGEVRSGEKLEAALGHLLRSESKPSDELRLLSIAILVLVEFGGPAAPAIDRLASTLRSQHAAVQNKRVQASHATASASLLALLPLVFGLILMATDEALADFYVFSVGGAACVGGALLLVAAGWEWMDRMVWR